MRFWNNLIDEAKEAKTYFAFKRILSKGINFIAAINLSQGHFHNYLHYTDKKFYLLFLHSPIFTYFLNFVQGLTFIFAYVLLYLEVYCN